MDLGTRRVQIISNRGEGFDGVVGYSGVVRLKQAPLERLHARGRLADDADRNRALFGAGETLREQHYLSGLSGMAANDLLGSCGGGHPSSRTPITEAMESARRKLRLAESCMDAGDWLILRAVVCDEFDLEEAGASLGFGNRAATQAVALDRLRRGLGDLAELWGYSPPQRPRPSVPVAANDGDVSKRAA